MKELFLGKNLNINKNLNEILVTNSIDKKNWPWNFNNSDLPNYDEKCEWPKISIITPSFNQGEYIEETIRSILLQDYPNLEYIIIDGGSTDNSLEIIKKYNKWITYWISEPDNGQSDAINKGLKICTGEIFNWINSDDLLLNGSLKIIANNIDNYDLLAGSVINFSNNYDISVKQKNLSLKNLLNEDTNAIYQQPGTWLKTKYLKNIGGLDESLDYCFDWYMMIHYLKKYPRVNYINSNLSKFRLHENSKTLKCKYEFRRERMYISYKIIYDKNFDYYEKLLTLRALKKSLSIEAIDRIIMNKNLLLNQKLLFLILNFANYIYDYPIRYIIGNIKNLIKIALRKKIINKNK